MKIKSLQIINLQQRKDINIKFNDDINIITGSNGSGKTTIIKVLWYLVSGNIERLFSEVDFDSLKLKTSLYDLNIKVQEDLVFITTKLKSQKKDGKLKEASSTEYCFNKYTRNIVEGKKQSFLDINFDDILTYDDEFEINIGKTNKVTEIDSINRMLVKLTSGSVFFPTFRRVEGGFSLTENNENLYKDKYKRGYPPNKLQEGLQELSNKLSVFDNHFISSISTHDITELLRRKHSETSEKVNQLHIGMSEFIEKKIEGIKENATSNTKDSVLSEIQKKVNSITSQREAFLVHLRLCQL